MAASMLAATALLFASAAQMVRAALATADTKAPPMIELAVQQRARRPVSARRDRSATPIRF